MDLKTKSRKGEELLSNLVLEPKDSGARGRMNSTLDGVHRRELRAADPMEAIQNLEGTLLSFKQVDGKGQIRVHDPLPRSRISRLMEQDISGFDVEQHPRLRRPKWQLQPVLEALEREECGRRIQSPHALHIPMKGGEVSGDLGRD